ncbi:MAG: hypothetical protein ACREPD_15595 [Stenotrophomonas sp.]|uniref:hypothetical protein n=1 Tax=Gammaproteobacteria TaxID=1236 RepID=UPI003D6D56DA
MIKVSGLDKLSRQLEQAKSAIAELDGDLGGVTFDPNEPSSIEAAIQQVRSLIDSKVEPWAGNPIVSQITESLKEQYRVRIIDRAAQARLESDEE